VPTASASRATETPRCGAAPVKSSVHASSVPTPAAPAESPGGLPAAAGEHGQQPDPTEGEARPGEVAQGEDRYEARIPEVVAGCMGIGVGVVTKQPHHDQCATEKQCRDEQPEHSLPPLRSMSAPSEIKPRTCMFRQ
jgi:hypothetical protein